MEANIGQQCRDQRVCVNEYDINILDLQWKNMLCTYVLIIACKYMCIINKIVLKFCYWWIICIQLTKLLQNFVIGGIIVIMYKIIMYVCILTTMRWIYGTNKIIKILLLVDYIWSYAYVC